MLCLVFTYGLQSFQEDAARWPVQAEAVKQELVRLSEVATNRFWACGSQEVLELPEAERSAAEALAQVLKAYRASDDLAERNVAHQFSFWM